MKDKDQGITIFNTEGYDIEDQYMFDGEPLNVARYDVSKFRRFENLNRVMIGQYWVPEEIDMTSDYNDYNNKIGDGAQHIFIRNLQYQTLLDSVQGRAPSIAFLPACTISELEGCITTWSFFEEIHSRSYTHIIRSVFNNPSEVFDEIVGIDEIIERAATVTECYNDYINAYFNYTTGNSKGYTSREIKEKRFDAVMSVYILEAIRFYVSFACSLALDNQGMMKKTGNMITLIARDEAQHKHLTQTIIRLWRDGKDDPEMVEIFKERKENSENLFKFAAEQEKEWAKYLFKEGSIRGLNENILSSYVDYLSNLAMKSIGLTPYCELPSHPVPWIETYFSSTERQNAPQETEETSYLVGAVDGKLDDDDLSEFRDEFSDDV